MGKKTSGESSNCLVMKFSGERTVTLSLLDTSGQNQLKVMYREIGCDLVEHVSLPPASQGGFGRGLSAWVDEEGRIVGKPENWVPFGIVSRLAGDVVLTRRGGWNGAEAFAEIEILANLYAVRGFRVQVVSKREGAVIEVSE